MCSAVQRTQSTNYFVGFACQDVCCEAKPAVPLVLHKRFECPSDVIVASKIGDYIFLIFLTPK